MAGELTSLSLAMGRGVVFTGPPPVSTAPAAFTAGQWSVADAASGGTATVTITALPSDGGSAITAIQYKAGAGAWTNSGIASTGTFNITGLTNGAAVNVLVRAVNAIGNGPDSDTKSVTPTAAQPVVVMPTPSFGSDNLRAWIDVRKSYTDWDGSTRLSAFYDDNGHSTVSYVEGLAGLGDGLLQFDKSLQPTKGPSGGILIDSNSVYMDFVSKAIVSGLSKCSIYKYARPIAGTTKRTGVYFSEGASSVPFKTVSVASAGSGYAVGDYITLTGGTGTQAKLKVTAVDGSGGVTSVSSAGYGAYTAPPANPVAQGSVSRPGGTSTGTGATFNLTFDAVGNGSTAARLATYYSNGTGGRKQSSTTAASDGSQIISANGTNSFGAPNNAALTDTTTFHRLGQEMDFTTGVVSYFYDNVADGTGTCAVGALNTSDSVMARVGNDNSLSAAGLMEIVAIVIIGDTLTSGRRALIDSYLQSGA